MRKLTRKQEKAFTDYLFQQDFISEGSGRKVYSWRAWVIKVAKNRNGLLQNKLEVKRFAKYGSQNLATIIAYSKRIVIMEKVDTDLTKLIEMSSEQQMMSLTSWLDKICEIDSLDHGDSQGITKDNRLVCYDYGDSKKTYSKKLMKALAFRELLASENTKEVEE